MSLNDIVQWICVAIILVIAITTAARGIIRLIKASRNGTDTSCSCGCSGCAISADCRKPNRRIFPNGKNESEAESKI